MCDRYTDVTGIGPRAFPGLSDHLCNLRRHRSVVEHLLHMRHLRHREGKKLDGGHTGSGRAES